MKGLNQASPAPGQVLFAGAQRGWFMPVCPRIVSNDSRLPTPWLGETFLNCNDFVKPMLPGCHTQHLPCTPNKEAHYHKTTRNIWVKTHPGLTTQPTIQAVPAGPYPEAHGPGSQLHSETDLGVFSQIPNWQRSRGSFLLQYQLPHETSRGDWQATNNFDLATC